MSLIVMLVGSVVVALWGVHPFIFEWIGFIVNVTQLPPIIQKAKNAMPKWMSQPSSYPMWNLLISTVVVCAIWVIPTIGASNRQEGITGDSKIPVVNQQAEDMARHFLRVFAAMPNGGIKADQKEWYEEYLSVVIPAKIETICGDVECSDYERLLKKLKSGSKNIQHHFRGVEPFVTKKRYIQPQTPPAGPAIEAMASAPKPLPQTAAPAELPLPTDKVPSPIIQASVDDRSTGSPPTNENHTTAKVESAIYEAVEVPPSPVPLPALKTESPVSAKKKKLEDYLKQTGWVQCHKCGTVHTLSYDDFATYEAHRCSRCNFHMGHATFSASIASKKQQLLDEIKSVH